MITHVFKYDIQQFLHYESVYDKSVNHVIPLMSTDVQSITPHGLIDVYRCFE
jgi:hypothetical protein